MRLEQAKIGMKVIKTRPYSTEHFYRFGGDERQVPLNSIGKIINIKNGAILVDFPNTEVGFRVDAMEIEEHVDGRTTTDRGATIPQYKAGKDMNEYITQLIECDDIGEERRKWLKTFKNCVLPDKVRTAVNNALNTVLLKSKFEEWGIFEHYEKGITNSILLYGASGTGKTMISESMAAVLGKNLLTISSAELQSAIPGQTERNIKTIFEQASDQNAVVLFDECDSILMDRSTVGAILGAEINALLTEIERFDGVVILTTNRLHMLDSALQRRIISKIELAEPNEEARKQIWNNLLPPKMPLNEDVDTNLLAKAELTGGEIKNAILIASRTAISTASENVTMQHFIDSVKEVLGAKRDYEKSKPKNVIRQMGAIADRMDVVRDVGRFQ